MKIHPLANIFDMWPAEKLQALADDIKDNGQIYPIIVDQDGETILDGRNRFAACKIAGVEPVVRVLPNGLNEEAAKARALNVITSATTMNPERTAGQKALFLAIAWPDTDTEHSGKEGVQSEVGLEAKLTGIHKTRLSQARTILRDADLRDQVIKGAIGFDAAYEKAHAAQKAAKDRQKKLDVLYREAPELHAQVVEDAIDLDEAYGQHLENKKQAAELLKHARDNAVRAVVLAARAIVSFDNQVGKKTPEGEFEELEMFKLLRTDEKLRAEIKKELFSDARVTGVDQLDRSCGNFIQEIERIIDEKAR